MLNPWTLLVGGGGFGNIQAMMKAEFEEWGTKTTIGVLAGMLYGGLREALGSAVRKKLHLSFLFSLVHRDSFLFCFGFHFP
jgi:hypothetical protein